jgi:type VI secretion system secreted protein VgrG
MGKYSQANRPIAITTPLGEDALLLEQVHGTEGISQLFRFELTLLSESETPVDFSQLLGQAVSVVIRPTDLVPRQFHGIINKLSELHRLVGVQGATFLRYQAEIVPRAWLLTRVARSRIFQQKTVPDVLKVVLGTQGVTYEIQGKFEPRDYCVQYRETDFAFASRLMEEEGIFYYFKHTAQDHTMVVANVAQSYAQVGGPESISYNEFTNTAGKEECITTWIKRQEIRSAKTTLWDYHFELPDKNLENKQSILQSVKVGTVQHTLQSNDQLELYDHPGGYAQRFDGIDASGSEQASELQKIFQDGPRTVGLRMQEEATGSLVIDGESDCRLLTPGHKFTLANHFNANGTYVLLRVAHDSSVEGTYTQDQITSVIYSNTFQCIPVALPYRPTRRTPKPRIEGPQTAVVVGPQGEEIFTDKYGRVKVQFHWHREGKNDAKSSCWVRVATAWAGKQWGIIHIPRIGQEVVVAFEEGDPDCPIIIGSVYNASFMPPYTLPDNKTQSGVKSRSTLQGDAEHFNELRFEDKKDSEDIFFQAQKDFHRVVENDDDLKVGHNQTIEIKNDRTETVKEGNESITIEKGNRTETIKKGDESVTLETGSRTHKIKKDDSLTIEGKHTIAVTGDQSITISQGNRSLTISVGNDTTKVSAGTSSTEAMQSIVLKVGGNSITIDQSGVTIKGIAVSIAGEASLDAKAPMTTVKGDGVLTLKGGVTMIN